MSSLFRLRGVMKVANVGGRKEFRTSVRTKFGLRNGVRSVSCDGCQEQLRGDDAQVDCLGSIFGQ